MFIITLVITAAVVMYALGNTDLATGMLAMFGLAWFVLEYLHIPGLGM